MLSYQIMSTASGLDTGRMIANLANSDTSELYDFESDIHNRSNASDQRHTTDLQRLYRRT